MSYLMHYGLDGPPEPPKRRRPLWKVAAAWAVFYAVIAVAALIAVSVVHTDRIIRTPVSDTPAPASGTAAPGAHR